MADYEGYDPFQANYGENPDTSYGLIPGLVFLASFAAISIGAYVTYGTLLIGLQPEVNGVIYYGLTYAEAVALDAAIAYTEANGTTLSLAMTTLINRVMAATPPEAYMASVNALIMYHHEFHNLQDYNEFIGYLEDHYHAECWGSPETQTYCIF